MRLLFRMLERKPKVMIHANKPRLDYLIKIGFDAGEVTEKISIRN